MQSPARLRPFALAYSFIFAFLVLMFYLGVMTLGGVRGLVGKESSWSKAQKQAAGCLERFAVSGEESEMACYTRQSRIMHSARLARLELAERDPDMDSAYSYLVGAGAHPADVAAMAMVVRRMAWHPVLRNVMHTWAEADLEVASMDSLATQLTGLVRAGARHYDPTAHALLLDVRATDARLTVLENRFSHEVSGAARYIRNWILAGFVLAALLLFSLAMFVSSRWIAAWKRAHRVSTDRAARMRAVAGAAAAVGGTNAVEELDVVLRAAIGKVIEGDMFTFGVYDAATHSFGFLAGLADGAIVPPVTVSAAGTPSERFLTDRSSILTHRSTDPEGFGSYQHGGPRRSESVIRSAMHSGSKLLGMIAIHSYTPHLYTDDDVEVIETLAAVAATAIQRFESTREQLAAEEGLRRSEEQLAQVHKMEAVGLLAGGIAHDFNNLLTAIQGNANLLASDETLPADAHEHVSEIVAASDRAASLTRQLLAFSRRQVLQPRVVDLNALVLDMSTLIRRLIGEDVHLLTSLDEELRAVRADPHQMEQVILNLALNARDAMSENGSLIIETCNVELAEVDPATPTVPPGSYVRLSVHDSGTGISPEDRDRIFEPFFTTKGVGKGTGLGLSTVFGIVKQTGGHIHVASAPGMGTTMQIFLPSTEAPVDPPLPLAVPRERMAPARHAMVLVVEDESTVRTLLSRVLTREGYGVIEAGSGEEALVLLRSDIAVDVLVTDTVMPGMNGVALAEHARQLRPGIAVLHMSGYTEDEVFRRGVSRRGQAFLQKPFSPAVLLSGVADALAAARGHSA